MKKDVKQSAVEVRKVLKSKYLGVKFSVRAKRFSGGSSVEVDWTNGPTEKEVREATEHLKGYANGYYNQYINVNRRTSRAVMEVAAQAVAGHYGVPVPEVLGGDFNPYVTDMTMVGGVDAICDKIHRAVWSTSLFGIRLEDAFKDAYN